MKPQCLNKSEGWAEGCLGLGRDAQAKGILFPCKNLTSIFSQYCIRRVLEFASPLL